MSAGAVFGLLVYAIQQFGMTLGVGAETIVVASYIRGDTQAQLAKKIVRAALGLIIFSGVLITAAELIVDGSTIFQEPAYLGKWLLIGLISIVGILGYLRTFEQKYVYPLVGGTWYALFILHTIAPSQASWLELALLYAFVLGIFSSIYAISIRLQHPTPKRHSEVKPAVTILTKPLPVAAPHAPAPPPIKKEMPPVLSELMLPSHIPAALPTVIPKPEPPRPVHSAPPPPPAPKPVAPPGVNVQEIPKKPVEGIAVKKAEELLIPPAIPKKKISSAVRWLIAGAIFVAAGGSCATIFAIQYGLYVGGGIFVAIVFIAVVALIGSRFFKSKAIEPEIENVETIHTKAPVAAMKPAAPLQKAPLAPPKPSPHQPTQITAKITTPPQQPIVPPPPSPIAAPKPPEKPKDAPKPISVFSQPEPKENLQHIRVMPRSAEEVPKREAIAPITPW